GAISDAAVSNRFNGERCSFEFSYEVQFPTLQFRFFLGPTLQFRIFVLGAISDAAVPDGRTLQFLIISTANAAVSIFSWTNAAVSNSRIRCNFRRCSSRWKNAAVSNHFNGERCSFDFFLDQRCSFEFSY